MAKRAFVFLAEGFEEIEAITPVDYLRRAGVEAVTVSINEQLTVKGAHGITVTADRKIADIKAEDFDALIMPGGMPGASNLAASKELDALLKDAVKKDRLICAICASPAVVLSPKGLLKNRQWTCFPSAEESAAGGKEGWCAVKVVVDANIITSRAPGTAADFALAIIEKLEGKGAAEKIVKAAVLSV